MTDVQGLNVAGILNSLTEAQKKVYEAIRHFKTKHGYPPTVREIGKIIGGKTPGAIQGILRRLEIKGAIRRQGGLARSIQLIEEINGLEIQETNELNSAAALYIPENEKNAEGIMNVKKYHPISASMLGGEKDCFMLQLPKNDTLIVKPGQVNQSDMAVVEHGKDILVGYFFEEGSNVVVKSALNAEQGQYFKKDEANVLGKLVGRYIRYDG